MANQALISWNAPLHIHTHKGPDWYWTVGIITLALAAVAIIFGQFIPGIFIIVAAIGLVVHISQPTHRVFFEINDRGLMINKSLYPFLSLESFWIPHNEPIPKLLIKSRKPFAPLMVIYIDGVDAENVREILLKYIAETEHHEPFLKHLLERLGF